MSKKQQQYRDWFNNARLLAKVVYYDRQLETIVKKQFQRIRLRQQLHKKISDLKFKVI